MSSSGPESQLANWYTINNHACCLSVYWRKIRDFRLNQCTRCFLVRYFLNIARLFRSVIGLWFLRRRCRMSRWRVRCCWKSTLSACSDCSRWTDQVQRYTIHGLIGGGGGSINRIGFFMRASPWCPRDTVSIFILHGEGVRVSHQQLSGNCMFDTETSTTSPEVIYELIFHVTTEF